MGTTRVHITLAVTLAAVAMSSHAWAQPELTGLSFEAGQEEARVIVALNPPAEPPAHRLMRDDQSLRLLLIDVRGQGRESDIDDQTVERVRIRRFGKRAVVRIDPHGSSSSVLERAEVRPHPQGLVVVIQRSDREAAAYRAAHAPSPSLEQEQGEQPASAQTAEDREEPAATPPVLGQRSPRSDQSSDGGDNTPSTTGVIRAVAAGFFVLLLGGFALWAKRRKKGGSAGADPSIDVVCARRLGARQNLLLVRVEGQQFLIGVSEKGMVRLASLDENKGQPMAAPDFGHALESAVESGPQDPWIPPEPQNAEPELQQKEANFAPAPRRRSEAVSGLLRLRQMAASAATAEAQAPSPQGPSNGNGNGKEMSLAGLESLLQSRQAN